MIFDLQKREMILNIPHKESFELIRSTLTDEEVQNIENEINSKLNNVDIINSGFIPGSDWRGTPYQVLFDKTANKHFEFAGLLFGLMVWITIQKRDDVWSFGNYPPHDLSKTYFKIKK